MARAKYRTQFAKGRLAEAIYKRLPIPHDKQRLIERSPAKRKVICCGRRAGKTTEGARVAVLKMCEGRRVLLASTTQEQADTFWEKCKEWLEPFITAGHIEKNETKRILLFSLTGGRIKVKTASDADTLRGDYADFLILDECAMLNPNAWNEVGAPMLLDNDGDCWFLSTPRRRNWFHGLYQRAIGDETGRWEAFHFTSHDNPHLSKDALQEITRELTDEAYRQEILAEFLAGEGAVFRNIIGCMTAPDFPIPEEHAQHYVVMGVDWGMVRDYTALSTFCSTCCIELDLDRFNQTEWVVQRERVIETVRLWHVQHVMAEENAIGMPNLEALSLEGVPIEAFKTTMQSKGQIIRAFALSLERNETRWRDVPVATGELEAYEAKISRITGTVQYSAPQGMHDDTVIARALALHAHLRGPAPAIPQAVAFSDISIGMDGDGAEREGGRPFSTFGGPSPLSSQSQADLHRAVPGLRYGPR